VSPTHKHCPASQRSIPALRRGFSTTTDAWTRALQSGKTSSRDDQRTLLLHVSIPAALKKSLVADWERVTKDAELVRLYDRRVWSGSLSSVCVEDGVPYPMATGVGT
jgi:hypothetical protein